ncbi:cell wall-binding repeat-containing protein [Euzebya tangerina]|uniref:cell wall-binding repeat-containing protein n=1 Tax=Euzebya tangerina TaxID=591198 RepID=UPI000E321A26|nr:cell wall-binding repeat-containing protein [Euzebya tangerina]
MSCRLLVAMFALLLLVLPAPATAQEQEFTVGQPRPSDLPETLDTERFRIHYTTDESSPDATSRDVAERMAAAFDEAYELTVIQEGWRPPLDDGQLGGDGRIDVYLKDLMGQLGLADYDGACEEPECPSISGSIRMEVDMADEDILGIALHELHHLTQAAISGITQPWLREATSTFEEVANTDRVRTGDIFAYAGNTDVPLRDAEDGATEYGAHVVMQWLDDQFDLALIQDIWARTAQNNGLPLAAMNDELVERGSSFAEQFVEFAEASMIWNQPGVFPRDTSQGEVVTYPEVARQDTIGADGSASTTLSPAAYAVYDIQPTADVTVEVSTADYLLGGAALVASRMDGTVEQRSGQFENGTVTLSLDGLDEAERVSVAVVNGENTNRGVEVNDITFDVQVISEGGPIPDGSTVPARVDGVNRYNTAAELAALDHPDGAEEVILARADDFPDALASAPLSPRGDVPVLVTDSDRLNDETARAITDLGASTAIIMGGTAAVGEAVVSALPDSVTDVQRVEGPNRFATAARAAELLAAERGINEVEGQTTAFVAQGGDFASALAAAPAAAAQGFPILLAETDRLPEETAQSLTDLEIQQVYLLGNDDQITPAVQEQIADLDITVERVAGADRLRTVERIAQLSVRAGWVPGTSVLLGRGDLFVDVLAAGPHGAVTGSPIVLTESPTRLGSGAVSYLADPTASLPDAVQAIGGTAAVSVDVLAAAIGVTDARGPVDSDAGASQFLRLGEDQAVAVGDAVTIQAEPFFPDQVLPETLAVGLLPCASSSVTINDQLQLEKADVDGDGRADALGSTDTGTALIVRSNGESVDGAALLPHVEVQDDQASVALDSSAGPDCTQVVAWEDEDGDGQLRLTEDGLVAELYGTVEVRFE